MKSNISFLRNSRSLYSMANIDACLRLHLYLKSEELDDADSLSNDALWVITNEEERAGALHISAHNGDGSDDNYNNSGPKTQVITLRSIRQRIYLPSQRSRYLIRDNYSYRNGDLSVYRRYLFSLLFISETIKPMSNA